MKTRTPIIVFVAVAELAATAAMKDDEQMAVLHDDPLGLVLSGGGAKGAYEVGVWQALEEAQVAPRVTVISGTSVGALNAAIFATRPDAAEMLWLEHMEGVFTINTNRVAESIQKTVDDASRAVAVAEETGEDWKGVASFLLASLVRLAGDYAETVASDAPRKGYIDSSKLATALTNALPAEWPANAPDAYATAFKKGSEGETSTLKLNGEPHEQRVSMLLASAAMPFVFDTVEIDGKTYVDGGWESRGGDNVPLEPILENHPDIKKVIVVYLENLYDEPRLNEKKRKTLIKQIARNEELAMEKGVELISIIPSEDIGRGFDGWQGVFDASPETARHLIELGRSDALKALGKLP